MLLLHGFPDHPRSFRYQLPALAKAGFHAVAPMLRGYEPSSQPKKSDYFRTSLMSDLDAFINQLGNRPVHLIGHDWGAELGYLYATLNPEKLLTLTTIGLPHPGRMQREFLRKRPSQLLKSWYIFFFQIPFLAEYFLERKDWIFVEKLWKQWSPKWNIPEEELLEIKKMLRQEGVKKTILTYYRNTLYPIFIRNILRTREIYYSKIYVPTLALTGELDGCMDTRLHDDLMAAEDFPMGLIVKRIPGAGHFPHIEQPDFVNQQIIKFILDNNKPL